MGFSSLLFDSNAIPIPCLWVPGVGFVALQGSPNVSTDGDNQYAPIALDLSQIGDLPTQMAGSDGVTATNVLEIASGKFNGLTLDMERNNNDNITILNEVNATTTQTSPMQINYNHRGCIVVLQTTAIGTGSITLSIQGIEPTSNYTWTILSGVAVTTNTTVLYKVHPSLPAASNSVAQDILPRSWQVLVTANNTNSATYAVYGIMCL